MYKTEKEKEKQETEDKDRSTSVIKEKEMEALRHKENSIFLRQVIEITSGKKYWMDLGSTLKVPRNYLTEIKVKNFDDTTSNIMMLEKWIEQDENASWDKLESALVFIGDKDVASKIREEYSKILLYLFIIETVFIHTM